MSNERTIIDSQQVRQLSFHQVMEAAKNGATFTFGPSDEEGVDFSKQNRDDRRGTKRVEDPNKLIHEAADAIRSKGVVFTSKSRGIKR